MMADVVVAFDHARRVMQVIAPVRPGGAPDIAYDAALARIDSYLKRIDEGPRGAELGAYGVAVPVPMEAHTTREQFIEQVEARQGAHRGRRHLPGACSRSATRRRTRATGSTSTACFAR